MPKKFYVAEKNTVKWSDPEDTQAEAEYYEEGDEVSHLPKDVLMSLAEAGSVDVKEVKEAKEEKKEEPKEESKEEAKSSPVASKTASSSSAATSKSS